ncbi:MAG: 4-aminobutyrate--2-oxoglutarate transaminase [Polyangiales bacterium]
MALSELPPAIDESGEAGSEAPLMRAPPPGAMSRAWLQRLQGVDAPWTEARRARNKEVTGFDDSPIVLVSAKGSNVADLDGNRYVDLAAGFGAALLGHGNTRVARTIEMQGERLMFGLGDVYPSDAKIGLTERLARLFPEPGARVMLGLSGADAIDAALKTALLSTNRPGIVAFDGSYHGLATLPLATCGLHPEFRTPFAEHLSTHVKFLPYPARVDDAEPARSRGDSLAISLEKALADVDASLASGDVGAIVVEPVLGRAGVIVPPAGFLKGLREICDRRGSLLIADEIWTGLGRSGALLRCSDEGVVPDIVCLGKGLGGGMPISACIGRSAVMEAWRKPRAQEGSDAPVGEAIHTSTHAGNPLACACAIAVLDSIIGTKLAARSKEEGAVLVAALKALPPNAKIRSVRGCGLMVGIEVEGGEARGRGLMRDLLSKGYLVLTGGAGDVITVTPPLNIPRTLLEGFVSTFGELAAMRAI